MQRRDFCKLIAAAAASKAVPSVGQAGEAAQSPADNGHANNDFDTFTEDYAKFCATPADQRVFHSFDGKSFVKEKLDEQTWQPTGSGYSRDLPTPAGFWDSVPLNSPIPNLGGTGPYKPTWDSLLQYDVPEWYRDAKFGIWAHWSPQCVPEDGDWYARGMYSQGTDKVDNPDENSQYQFQLDHYGHPSRFGYKDLCPQWTLLNWEPDELIQRYKKAGARLFIALANHHDSFDTWNSRHQPWNAAHIGPHRDVVGDWAAAARNQGLRFGVTVHQARNWWWFQTSHGADKTGPLAGVPYDGRLTQPEGKNQWWQGFDPQRIYGAKHPYNALPDISYVKNFYDRTRDLIDQHDPDLLYFDDRLLPLGWAGMNIGSYYYNHNLKTHSGRMEAVLNIKEVPDRLAKSVVADYERGITNQIMPYAWQSETCIGDWHYQRSLFNQPGEYGGYLHPRDIIHWLIDAVSKNGTFILNIPGKPDGTIDRKEIAILDKITDWMQVNGEAIYATRPWKVFGEGPNMKNRESTAAGGGNDTGTSVSNLGPTDIRFTRNKANTVIYAFTLGWPKDAFIVPSLGTSAATNPGRIEHVELLGTGERLAWKQTAMSLRVELPKHYHPTTDYAAALKISLT
ncbi:MAG TPA: alpha-L-fucosidase [Acidobacteriaceae bacterium]|jgi:alpha-L-fucosidase|nr:alpha-L-fucosidase [Acidobacteriaceae bacterium]